MIFSGLDLETGPIENKYALQPWRAREGTGWITMASVWCDGRWRVEKQDYDSVLNDLRRIGKPVVCHNTIFDLAWLYATGHDLSGLLFFDSALLWKFLKNGQNMPMQWHLKNAARTFLKDWEHIREFLELKSTDIPNEDDPYWERRAALDAEACALIADQIWPQLLPTQQNLAKIQAVTLPMIAMSWVNGIRIDLAGIEAERPKVIDSLLVQEHKLGMVEPGSTHENYIPSKILRSPIKLRKVIYEDWGHQVEFLTEKGQPSTDKTALTYLADVDERISDILVWREYNTIMTKFINTPLEACTYLGSDVTHSAPRVFATYTKRGSFSSKIKGQKVGMALHQMPRGPRIRQYILPHENEFVVEFDVMAQEARWMAVMSNDHTMLELFKSDNPDIHSFMGSRLAGITFEEFLERKKAGDEEVTGAHGLRNLGKFCNLSFNYRISPPAARRKAKVDYNMDTDVGTVRGWLETFKQSYPGIPKYWKSAPKQARARQCAVTLAGNIYRITKWKEFNWMCSSSAINFPIQGISSDQKELSMAVLATSMPEVQEKLLFEMHDALHLSIPKNAKMGYLHSMNYFLDTIDYKKYWGYEPPIPFPWEGSLGPSEGSKIDFDYSCDPDMTLEEYYRENKQ